MGGDGSECESSGSYNELRKVIIFLIVLVVVFLHVSVLRSQTPVVNLVSPVTVLGQSTPISIRSACEELPFSTLSHFIALTWTTLFVTVRV